MKRTYSGNHPGPGPRLDRDRPDHRRGVAGAPRRVDLLSDRRRRDARLRLVPVPRPIARRLDLYRPVHPERDLGLRRSARQCVGDGAVADGAAGAVDRGAAGDADADPRRQPVEARRRRHCACGGLRHRQLCGPRLYRRNACAGASRAKLAGHGRPVRTAGRRRLAVLWRDPGGVALLAADADRSVERRQASQGVGSAYRRASRRPALRQALRDREHAAQDRQFALHLHRQERDHRARRSDRQAGVAGRPEGPGHVDPVHDRVPRRRLLPDAGRGRRDACAPAGSSKGRSIRA